jgi:hypothetical protein
MKTCTKCGETKEPNEFRKDRTIKPDGLVRHCKSCQAGLGDAKKARTRWVRWKYKMSVEEYDALYAAQEGKCAICGTNGDTVLYIDHCHASNEVRGLLCQPCNSGIGMFKDDPTLLSAAIQYLKEKG